MYPGQGYGKTTKEIAVEFKPNQHDPLVTLASDHQKELAERVLLQPIPPQKLSHYHHLYKRQNSICYLAQYVFIDYQDSNILHRAGQYTLHDLVRSNEEQFFEIVEVVQYGANMYGVYGFNDRLKKIFKKILFLLDILESDPDFKKLSFKSTNICFASDDLKKLNFPRLVLEFSDEEDSQNSARKLKAKSKQTSSSSRISSSGTIIASDGSETLSRRPCLKLFGEFLMDFMTKSTVNVTFLTLREGEQRFIHKLEGATQNWSFEYVLNHPALWYTIPTASKYLREAHHFVNKARSRHQRAENSQTYSQNQLNNTQSKAEWVAFWAGLPLGIVQNSKYSGWRNIIAQNPYLESFYQHSIKERASKGSKGGYPDNLGGLFQFKRNAIQHFYDVDANAEPVPTINRFDLSEEELMKAFLNLFPNFFFDIYPDMAGANFAFKEFNEEVETANIGTVDNIVKGG